MANPQSRNEEILQSIVDKTTYDKSPQSREEVLLLEIKDLIQGGGTSDVQGLVLTMNSSTYVITAYLIDGEGQQVGDSQTIDIPLEATIVDASYNNLTKTITFTLTSGAYLTVPIGDIIYGLQPLIDAQHKLPANLVDDTQGRIKFTYVGTQAQYAQDAATIPAGTPVMITDDTDIDAVPTDGSTNPVESNGVYDALAGKVDKVQGKQLSTEDFTTAYKNGLAVMMANPLNHNAIFRGANLTNVYTVDEIYAKVHDGSFDDLYLGDYFTVSITTDIMTKYTGETFESGVDYYEMGGGTDVTARTWTLTEDTEPQSGKTYATKLTKTENVDLMIAAFDYYYNTGDSALTNHHVILIPRGAGFATTAKMNDTATTVGAYFNSDMHQIVLPCYAKSLKSVLNNHVKKYRASLSSAMSTNVSSMAGAGATGASVMWNWSYTEAILMSETQVYGTTVWSSSVYDIGTEYKKFPIFDYAPVSYVAREDIWLKNVSDSTHFASVSAYGNANYAIASSERKVFPVIVFG